MGNQPSGTSAAAAATSSSSSTHMTAEDRLRPLVAPFVRQTGSLGLSRQELDKRCQPSGYVIFFSYLTAVLCCCCCCCCCFHLLRLFAVAITVRRNYSLSISTLIIHNTRARTQLSSFIFLLRVLILPFVFVFVFLTFLT